ncbi:protein-export chaperone SecB [Zavarzinia sp. CC-PAN008]|uniref:protein-export chaperone SecB n=1 Tax=Zavarzinia sp. CC-PAN008 TaxID=3243332 RepID=UPI003F742EE5
MSSIDPGQAGNGGQPNPNAVQVGILAQYVRDLSFENPNAPQSLAMSSAPRIEVAVDVQARRAGTDRFEVELKIQATAKNDDRVAFVCELSYAGLFSLRNIPEESVQPFLLIECPRLIFPFARRIVADATRDGGFPPVMLDPIDFATLYRQRMAQAQAEAAQAPAQA